MSDTVIINRIRDPFEIMLSCVFALSGTYQLLSNETPNAVNAMLPPGFRYLWLGMIVAGSLAVLFGVYWRNVITGMYVESVGLLAVSCATAIYGSLIMVASIQLHSIAGMLLSSPMTLAIGLAYYAKYRQVLKVLERLPHHEHR